MGVEIKSLVEWRPDLIAHAKHEFSVVVMRSAGNLICLCEAQLLFASVLARCGILRLKSFGTKKSCFLAERFWYDGRRIFLRFSGFGEIERPTPKRPPHISSVPPVGNDFQIILCFLGLFISFENS